MRIAQIAPLAEAVPPKLYGGTERVVSWLTEELVQQGHDVTLFASGDSTTSATLVPGCPQGLRLAGVRDHLATMLVMLHDVRRRAHEFDIIHFHVDLLQQPLFESIQERTLTTMHGRLDLPDFMPIYEAFADMPFVSISDSQRNPMPATTNWVATIHHGLPPNLIPFNNGAGGYLAFLGRICPDKRLDRAIEIAKRIGMPLRVAAKIDPVDRKYFEDVIEPMLQDPLIEFVGEVGDAGKAEFLGNATALLFPIDWPEPFGLVMIEAMSAGTPVVAWRNGSVPEIITPGRSGYIVDSIDEAVAAVAKAVRLDRRKVRAEFDNRFTLKHMADRYIAVYEQMIARTRPALRVVNGGTFKSNGVSSYGETADGIRG